MVNPKSYVCTDRCCSEVSAVPGSSGGQAGEPLHSGFLFVAFQILGGPADHECFLFRFYVCLCSRVSEAERLLESVPLCHATSPEFEALRSSILHRHPLPSLTEAVAEFTSEETRLPMLSSLFAPVQSVFSPTTFATPYHPLLMAHSIVSHYFVGKWTEDNILVGAQLSRFNARFVNNLRLDFYLP